jgi:hypothetical protein
MNFSLTELPVKFKQVIFWNDFYTPEQLLLKTKADKVIFFEIIDLRQIALIVTAKKLGITTFYLEHGAAGDKNTAISRWNEITILKHKLPYFLKRIRSSFFDVFRSKLFYYSVRGRFESWKSYLKYLKLPFLMLTAAPNKVLAHCIFKERVPRYSIVFNRVNFEQYQVYTGISEGDAIFTGVPFFDKFYTDNRDEKDYVVFIDHPYLEERLLEWTREHHEKIAKALFQFAAERKIKVYIKLHPISNMDTWKAYRFNNEYVEIIQKGDFTSLYMNSKLILGFSSSLLNGFLCAKKNVVLLGWHPAPQIFGNDFSKSGLCHSSVDIADLSEQYSFWISDNKCTSGQSAYDSFLKQCNYPFDGKATQRVLDAILTL